MWSERAPVGGRDQATVTPWGGPGFNWPNRSRGEKNAALIQAREPGGTGGAKKKGFVSPGAFVSVALCTPT